MNSNLTISLNVELIEKLKKEENYSDLINQQIKAYYEVGSIKNIQILKQELSKTKQIIKENNKKKREIVRQLENIREKEKEILKVREKNWDFRKLSVEDKGKFIREKWRELERGEKK